MGGTGFSNTKLRRKAETSYLSVSAVFGMLSALSQTTLPLVVNNLPDSFFVHAVRTNQPLLRYGAEDRHCESMRLGLIQVRSWPYSRVPLNTVQCQTCPDVCKQVTRFLGEADCSEKGVIRVHGRHPKGYCKLEVGCSRRAKQSWKKDQGKDSPDDRKRKMDVLYIEIHKLSLSSLRLSDRLDWPDLSLSWVSDRHVPVLMTLRPWSLLARCGHTFASVVSLEIGMCPTEKSTLGSAVARIDVPASKAALMNLPLRRRDQDKIRRFTSRTPAA